jgi:aminopeptidase N
MKGSYHDEWLDEGFATYSAALYLQTAEGVDRFEDYMETLRRAILGKTAEGVRATDLGPIWLGRRLSSLKTPFGRELIYAKGAYVLHMLRMMLFDYEAKSDSRFITMMRDYVHTYSGTKVTTEEFRRFVERHLGEEMDWFFRQWVYGVDIPVYHFSHRVDPTTDGQWVLTVSIRQEGVSSDFKMPLRFVINFDRGHAVAGLLVTGTEPVEKQFKLPVRPKSVDVNPWSGVLCEMRR